MLSNKCGYLRVGFLFATFFSDTDVSFYKYSRKHYLTNETSPKITRKMLNKTFWNLLWKILLWIWHLLFFAFSFIPDHRGQSTMTGFLVVEWCQSSGWFLCCAIANPKLRFIDMQKASSVPLLSVCGVTFKPVAARSLHTIFSEKRMVGTDWLARCGTFCGIFGDLTRYCCGQCFK